MIPLVIGAIFIGRVAVIIGVCLLALVGFREFARATGLYDDWWLTGLVYFSILMLGLVSLIPDPRLWLAPNRNFSLRTALRREPDTIFSTVASLIGLQLVWHGFVSGAAPVGTFWIALLAGTLVFWLALKWMKRFTNLLRVHAQPAPQSPVR